MAGERADGTVFEGFLDFRQRRIGIDDVTATFKELGVFNAGYLDFAADIFGSLAPFKFNYDLLAAVFIDNIFGHAVARIFNIHLDDNRTVTVVVAQESVDAAVKFRSVDDFTIFEN